ncbi:MAG: hypothetical protein KUG53_00090 [Pseudomonadales bacterium]|nr:hypothetical protein [Pseudomonadales bacterium]
MINVSKKVVLYSIVVIASMVLAIYIAKPDRTSEITPTSIQNQNQQIEPIDVPQLEVDEDFDHRVVTDTNQPVEHLSTPVSVGTQTARQKEARKIATDNISHANVALTRLGSNLQDNEDQVNVIGGYVDEQNQLHLPETASRDEIVRLEFLAVEREGIIAEMAQYQVTIGESEDVLNSTE